MSDLKKRYGSMAYNPVANGKAVPYANFPFEDNFAKLIITTSKDAINVPRKIGRNEKCPIFQFTELINVSNRSFIIYLFVFLLELLFDEYVFENTFHLFHYPSLFDPS